MTRSIVRISALAFVLCALAPTGLVDAQEESHRNDSLVTASSGNPCNCFLEDEQVASWLTARCTGSIVALQVGYASIFGGANSVTQKALRLKAAGTFPVPGATMTNTGGGDADIPLPQLADGALNEFRWIDPGAMTVPLDVPVTQGQTFVVALEYLNQTDGGAPTTPDVVWDNDTCQAEKNTVFASSQWLDACPAGVQGDWMIRAVIDCQLPSVDAIPRNWTWLPLLLLGALLSAALWLHRPQVR